MSTVPNDDELDVEEIEVAYFEGDDEDEYEQTEDEDSEDAEITDDNV